MVSSLVFLVQVGGGAKRPATLKEVRAAKGNGGDAEQPIALAVFVVSAPELNRDIYVAFTKYLPEAGVVGQWHSHISSNSIILKGA